MVAGGDEPERRDGRDRRSEPEGFAVTLAERVEDIWADLSVRTRVVALGVTLLGLVLAAFVGANLLRDDGTSGGAAAPLFVPESPVSTAASKVVVHVAGAVRAPGLHSLSPGARVADALAAAGGPTLDADLDRVNLAAAVADGQRVVIARIGEAIDADGPASGPGETGSGPVNLNQADAAALDSLPGVGPATASAIVDHRRRNGPFRTVDDLLSVRGIGPSKLDALRDLVTVG